MYRAVALAAIRAALGWDDPAKLAALARRLRIEVLEDRVLLDGQDVTAAIRMPEITTVTHYAADNPEVRPPPRAATW
jgi:cytidylate kinase